MRLKLLDLTYLSLNRSKAVIYKEKMLVYDWINYLFPSSLHIT